VESRAPNALGITADISDSGCSLLWPVALGRGALLPLRVHFGPKVVDWTGEVVSDLGVTDDGWHRYGVQFRGLSPADVDLVNDSVFTLVVPDLFRMLVEPSWPVRMWRRARLRLSRTARTRARRRAVRLPARLRHAGGSAVVTARDLSASGLSVMSPVAVTVGSKVELSIAAPRREWRGAATVVRAEAQPSRPGFETWRLGLRFESENAAAESLAAWDAA
jgi:hypothetical protein